MSTPVTPTVTLGDQQRWHEMGMEARRYEYDLKAGDCILDIGAYDGSFTREMIRRYPGICATMIEPTNEINHFSLLGLNYKQLHIMKCAVGGEYGKVELGGEHNWASRYFADHLSAYDMIPFHAVVTQSMYKLCKINVEGMEYDMMDDWLSHRTPMIENFQIQFHKVEGMLWKERYERISCLLAEHHDYQLTWREPFVWENWQRKL